MTRSTKRKRKKLQFFTTVFLLASAMSFSQTEEDYSNALETLKKGFNESNTSLIYNKFNADLKSSLGKDNLDSMINSLRKENGTMESYDLILSEDGLRNYLVEFKNSSLLVILGLKKEGISTFEIKNY